jgi:RNA polymerase sigma-70 factor (ECF subfamily)
MMPSSLAADAPPDPSSEPPSAGPASPAFLHWVGDLAREHRARLAALARHEGLTAEDAVDSVQEAFHTFLTLPAARALTGADDDARRLLITITRNAARNRRRAHALARPHTADAGVLASLHDEGPGADELIASAETRLQLASCVRCLGDAQRAVVSLRLLDDVPGQDVARALGISPGHVAVLLHRAKANLVVCMTRAAAPDTCTTGR